MSAPGGGRAESAGLVRSLRCVRAVSRSRVPHSARCKDRLRIALILHCLLYVNARTSQVDDLLSPYHPLSKHGPSRSHRETRDCLRVTHGNKTHETWPSNNDTTWPAASTRIYISMFPGTPQKAVYGHFTFINNPLKTVSVLEPGSPGGCASNLTATVEETAKHGKCLVAQNGGYFNTTTFQCLGNVVSNGRLVQSSKGIQNAQFGIREDGTMVFGYLSEEEVLDTENPFVQLVSGVVWLLRNGEVYIGQSKKVECDETQTTGNFDEFIDTMSARTAVGHDTKGRLILFHADGQTAGRGLSLWEMANFLKAQGVYNAINLDGGGSATLVLNGTLASYPSDHCLNDSMWRCQRSVSTIVCVHEPYCDPPDCGGHGQCVAGACHCTGYWTGSSCDVLLCGPSNCSGHGMCTQSGCKCDAGWNGSNCSNACIQGYYGDGCASKCQCQNNGTCDHINGNCMCPDSNQWAQILCPLGFYGLQCQKVCLCEKQCYCDHVTGSCNVTRAPVVTELLMKVGYCVESLMYASWWKAVPSDSKIIYFTEQTWAIVSCTLAVLLVISAAFNIKQVWTCRERRTDWTYSYQQLREMNGNVDVPDMYEACDLYNSDFDVETSHLESGS
ncbi:PREDICTED: N-acetylglucosamine-1-phosphodiester alpha-N-acetylglucosaminidase [Nanorana parkeri]|uniref:N-acetylglucosamine-1-phosphodiester alpha-N-acetylglucosaminidase n=1 Tax=Nanorana parkeri TaxID=125878 RepID=UPI0008547745|nr:PREDICTED: N-acetylglucosamine-1-phosphodiester alpha-N-acetylglucosaminidase [Nanorana parkeri]